MAVPACANWHGRGDAHVPGIAGQDAAYLVARLDAFARMPQPDGPAWHPMPFIAAHLDSDDRAAVAGYDASLPIGDEPGLVLPAADDARAVALIQKVCKTCHTETGVGSPSGEYPNISLQGPIYIRQQLQDFRARERRSTRMEQVADALDPADMDAVARYFGERAALMTPPPDRADPDADPIRGGVIATDGLPDRHVPACLSCHGERADVLPLIPRLEGQNPTYLAGRLRAFADARPGDLSGLNPMHATAAALTAEDRRDVAAWFATQPPAQKTLTAR